MVALVDFLENMRRHLQRDVRNTQEYYLALKKEMEVSLQKPNLSQESRQERINKINALPEESARKVADLQQKYQVKVKLTACAALRFLVPVVRLLLEVRYRKFKQDIRLIYNPISHHFDPLICSSCETTTQKLQFLETKSKIELVCSDCAQKK